MKTTLTTSNTLLHQAKRSCFCLGVALIVAIAGSAQVQADLVNGDFEENDLGAGPTFEQLQQQLVPGWFTTAGTGNADDPSRRIELWANGFDGLGDPGFPVNAASGNNHAELNASEIGTLYQEVSGIAANQRVNFSFFHRGRLGDDTMALTITDLGTDNMFGTADDTTLFTSQYTSGNMEWTQRTSFSQAPIITLGNDMRFAYESISAAGGNNSIGNFIDKAEFGLNVIPEPSGAAVLLLGAVGLLGRRRR